jgi:hypothetical protein
MKQDKAHAEKSLDLARKNLEICAAAAVLAETISQRMAIIEAIVRDHSNRLGPDVIAGADDRTPLLAFLGHVLSEALGDGTIALRLNPWARGALMRHDGRLCGVSQPPTSSASTSIMRDPA